MAGCYDSTMSVLATVHEPRTGRDYRPRPPRAREMMERDTAVAFDALAAMPNAFLRPSPGRPMPGLFTAAFASAAAAFAARLALRSARTLSAASWASVGVRVAFGVASGFLVIAPSVVVVFSRLHRGLPLVTAHQ